MPVSKKPELTVKQRKFVKGVAQGKKKSVAYVEAGYKASTPNVASVESSKLLKKPSIQEALLDVYERRGISMDRIIAPFDDALDASKQNEYTGEVTVDHTTRMSAARTLAGFIGLGKESSGGTTVNNFGSLTVEMKNKYEDD